jgi:hypothetical protein
MFANNASNIRKLAAITANTYNIFDCLRSSWYGPPLVENDCKSYGGEQSVTWVSHKICTCIGPNYQGESLTVWHVAYNDDLNSSGLTNQICVNFCWSLPDKFYVEASGFAYSRSRIGRSVLVNGITRKIIFYAVIRNRLNAHIFDVLT